MSVKFLLKLALRTQILLKLSYASTANSDMCNHLAHVKVLCRMQKFICYCTVFALFYFQFEGNFQGQAPRGLYLEGRFNGGLLGLQVWRTYLERLLHGGLWQ